MVPGRSCCVFLPPLNYLLWKLLELEVFGCRKKEYWAQYLSSLWQQQLNRSFNGRSVKWIFTFCSCFDKVPPPLPTQNS